MEHLRAFGLSRDPFTNDPVEAFYYESPLHRGAERRLLRALEHGRGLCLLVGEAGAGKTLVARRVLEALEEEAYEAGCLVVLQSGLDARWLLSRVAALLGVEEPAERLVEILAQVHDRLSVFAEEGRRPVVIVDDAHLLARRDLMEGLRALLDLEHEERRPLSLVLVGELELDGVLRLDPGLPHRLDARVCLEPMDVSTAAAYLGHRITAAGGYPSLFEPAAVEAIQHWGKGLPRRMNVLADNALFEAHLAGRTRVLNEDVERAARDLGIELDVATVADAVPPRQGPPPGGEPLELTRELSPESPPAAQRTRSAGRKRRAGSTHAFAFDDEIKDAEEAQLFDSPATVVMDEGDPVDRDVDELFDDLIDD